MRKGSLTVILFLIMISLFTYCKKSVPPAVSSFVWSFNGGDSDTANLHKAFQSSMATTPIIVATKGSSIRSFDVAITVSSFTTGSYNVNGSGANSLLYIDSGGNEFNASSGTVNITNYSTNRISGNFTAVVNRAGGSFSLTGSFNDTPVEP